MEELEKLEQDLAKCYEVVVEVASASQVIEETSESYNVHVETLKKNLTEDQINNDLMFTAKVYAFGKSMVPGIMVGGILSLFVAGKILGDNASDFAIVGSMMLCVAVVVTLIMSMIKQGIYEELKENDQIQRTKCKQNYAIYIEYQEKLKKIVESDNMAVLQEIIPEMYMNVDAVENFLALIQNKRAESLKEAINLYEDIKHKEEMMMKQNEALELQHQSLDMLANQAEMQKQQMANFSDFQKKQLKSQQKLVAQSKKLSKQARYGNVVGTVNMVCQWNK